MLSKYNHFIRLSVLILALASTLACNTVTSLLSKPTATPTEAPRPAATPTKTARPTAIRQPTLPPTETFPLTETLPPTIAPTMAPAGGDALSGSRIKIIYTAERTADAQEAQSRLEALGADIIMLQVANAGIEDHIGKVYYIDGNQDVAVQVAAEVADIETVEPTLQTAAPDMGQQVNLWIASSQTTAAPTTAPAGGGSLSGLRIKIIYIAARTADAQEAQARLQALGVDVVMLETSDSGNGDHIGKLYYVQGYQDQAVQVAALVADLETVKPTVLPIAPDVGQQLNIWIATPK